MLDDQGQRLWLELQLLCVCVLLPTLLSLHGLSRQHLCEARARLSVRNLNLTQGASWRRGLAHALVLQVSESLVLNHFKKPQVIRIFARESIAVIDICLQLKR